MKQRKNLQWNSNTLEVLDYNIMVNQDYIDLFHLLIEHAEIEVAEF